MIRGTRITEYRGGRNRSGMWLVLHRGACIVSLLLIQAQNILLSTNFLSLTLMDYNEPVIYFTCIV